MRGIQNVNLFFSFWIVLNFRILRFSIQKSRTELEKSKICKRIGEKTKYEQDLFIPKQDISSQSSEISPLF